MDAVDNDGARADPAVRPDLDSGTRHFPLRKRLIQRAAGRVAAAAQVTERCDHRIFAYFQPRGSVDHATGPDVDAGSDSDWPVLSGDDASAADQHAVLDPELSRRAALRIQLTRVVNDHALAYRHLRRMSQCDVATPDDPAARGTQEPGPESATECQAAGARQQAAPSRDQLVLKQAPPRA